MFAFITWTLFKEASTGLSGLAASSYCASLYADCIQLSGSQGAQDSIRDNGLEQYGLQIGQALCRR